MTNTNTAFWGNPGWIFSEIGDFLNPYHWLSSPTNGNVTTQPSSGGGDNALITIKPTMNIDTPALVLIGVAAYFLLTK